MRGLFLVSGVGCDLRSLLVLTLHECWREIVAAFVALAVSCAVFWPR